MKIKPAAVIAAVLLLSLAPLGMQAMAISDVRQRIALLESHGLVASSDSSARQAIASDRSAAPVNLVALADALLAAKEGDLVKRLTTEKKVSAMNADELERLLTESATLELGPEQRNALVHALFRQFCRVAEKSDLPCERVVSLIMTLSPSMRTGQGTLWNLAGKNVDRWVDQNPDEAVEWYRKMGKTSAAEESSILIARVFDGLHRRSRDEAIAFFRSLNDAEKQAVFGGGGRFQHPDLMIDLSTEIEDQRLRSTAVNVLFHSAEGKSAQEVRGWIDKIQPSTNEAAQLLATAASGIRGERSAAEILKRIDWLREAAEGLDVAQATGIYLSNIGNSSLATVKQALDAEWKRNPDERMLASYISRCMFNQELILDAIPRSQLITDQALRDSALGMMLLSSRSTEDARNLARKGGMDEKEIDRLIPRER